VRSLRRDGLVAAIAGVVDGDSVVSL
jgi:hypothetical protein